MRRLIATTLALGLVLVATPPADAKGRRGSWTKHGGEASAPHHGDEAEAAPPAGHPRTDFGHELRPAAHALPGARASMPRGHHKAVGRHEAGPRGHEAGTMRHDRVPAGHRAAWTGRPAAAPRPHADPLVRLDAASPEARRAQVERAWRFSSSWRAGGQASARPARQAGRIHPRHVAAAAGRAAVRVARALDHAPHHATAPAPAQPAAPAMAPTPAPEPMAALEAAFAGDAARLQAQLAAGVPIDCRDELGYTPLMWAAQAGRLDVLALLLRGGAELDATDAAGRSALLVATVAGQLEAARRLIMAGADPELAAADGVSPLGYARAYDLAPFVALMAPQAPR